MYTNIDFLFSFYDCSSREATSLSERFNISRFILIVMKYAMKSYPEYSKYLDDLNLHPAVLKAIFYEG